MPVGFDIEPLLALGERVMHPNAQLLQQFYDCFQRSDPDGMAVCYNPQIVFSDPAFGELRGAEPAAMWKMLISSSKDLRLTFRDIQADDQQGSAHWEAWYTFSATHRHVHNVIEAHFQFLNGEILMHRDTFDYWKWASQALGLPGLLLGWTPFLRHKTNQTARGRLCAFMQQAGLPISEELHAK
jgi:hypothetical protein